MSQWQYRLGRFDIKLQEDEEQPAVIALGGRNVRLTPKRSRFLEYMIRCSRAHRADIVKHVWNGEPLTAPVKQLDQLFEGLETKVLEAKHKGDYFAPDGSGYIEIKGLVPLVELSNRSPGAEIFIAKLPKMNSLLFGRETELRRLDEAWDDPITGLVSIVAFGGVGKTSLAMNWWRRNGVRRAKRVLGWSFHSQGAAEDRQASADPFLDHALRVWFGIEESPASSFERGELLAHCIRREPVLLILDGLEPIQHARSSQAGALRDEGMAALLRELEAQNPGLCICTSRLPLTDLAGVGMLTIDLDNLTEEAGGEYLNELGVKGDIAELQQASREFGNHALALTLLGRYLVRRLKGDVRKRDTIPSILDEPNMGGHARRMLRQYEALFEGTPELEILRAMGLFDRPADEVALGILRNHVLPPMSDDTWADRLFNLRDARLIEFTDPYGNLDCHPLIREHFAEEFRVSKPEVFEKAHGHLYRHYKSELPATPDTLEAMSPLFNAVYHGCRARKYRQVRNQLDWVFPRGDEHFLTVLSFGVNLSVLANLFEDPWKTPVGALSLADRAWLSGRAGFCLHAVGRLIDAVEPLKFAADARLRLKAWDAAAISLAYLSETYATLGFLEKAVRTGWHSVEAADQGEDAYQRTISRMALAHALHQCGDLARATTLFEEADNVQRQHKRTGDQCIRGYRYCVFLMALGKTDEVKRRASHNLADDGERSYRLRVALDHLCLGQTCVKGSSDAVKYFDEAIRGFRGTDAIFHLPDGYLARAAHFRGIGEFSKAQSDLDNTRLLAFRCGMRLHLTDYHLEQARLILELNPSDHRRANHHFEDACKLVEETGYHRRDTELKELSEKIR